jgi:phage/plasmid-like protein (TIGR03299 family)
MPSGITETDSMMYTDKIPWHGLGTKLDNPATASEAIVAAGLDWAVVQRPVYTPNQAGHLVEIPNRLAVIREDTDETFAIMSAGYMPSQNWDAFGATDALVAQGAAVYHTAGSLFGGRKIWLLIKLPDDIEIIKGDVIQPYLLLYNSHDGSQALRMVLTPIRVVCDNTLSVALNQATGGFYAKHTRNIMSRVAEAREVLGLADAYYKMFNRQIDQLVNSRLTALQTQDYLQRVYEFDGEKTYEQQDYRRLRAYESTLDLLGHPSNTFGGIAGTKYAALNAVTYYVDHERSVGGSATEAGERRLNGSWFGMGAKIRQRAFDLLQV